MNQPDRSFAGAFAGRFAIALPTTELSDTVQSMSAAMQELLKDRGATEDIVDVLSLDGNQATPVLRFSALVVVFRTRKNTDRLAYHTLILAGSAPKLEPQYVNLNQNPMMYGGVQGKTEIVLVPGDAYDEDYRIGVENFVKRHFPSVTDRLAADARVVAADFDFTDTRAVKLLANSAITAAGVRFLELDGVAEIDISQIPTRPDQFSIRTSLISPVEDDPRDLSGNPYRADFKTVFGSSQLPRQGINQSLNGGTASNFTQATGYVDLVQTYQRTFNQWAMPVQTPYGQQPMPYAKYAPRVIITSLKTLMGPSTLTSNLLALFGVFSLAEPNALYPFFESQGPTGSGINVREIGALNIKANLWNNETGLGEKIVTSGTDYNRAQLQQYLSTVLEPEVFFSVDIEECGDDTWVNYPLAMAASLDDALAKKGNQLIANGLDLLTGGNFSRIHPTGMPIVMQGAERIINGKYSERSGKIRSFQHIDYLHVLNLEGENAPQLADQYANTFIATQEPLPQRISNRLQIFRSLYPSINLDSVTGYSQRITLTPQGINSFIEAMSAAKLNVANIPAGSGLGLQQAPIYASLQAAGVAVAQHSVFNKAQAGFGVGSQSRGNGGRW
jgi:hypothetical protein